MRTAYIEKHGPPEAIEIKNVDVPKPKSNELLVKVHSAALNPLDAKMRSGEIKIAPARAPRSLGSDFSGTVVEVGSSVPHYSKGDEVFGAVNQFIDHQGSCSEYVTVKPNQVSKKPNGFSFEDAAACPVAGVTAVQGLRMGNVKAGSRILINGASGGVGSYTVQIAKLLGANVTATCGSRNIKFVQDFGADHVIDYTKQNLNELSERFDIIYDASAKMNFWKVRKLLTKNGVYLTTLPQPGNIIGTIATSLIPGKKSKLVVVKVNPTDLDYIAHLSISGKIKSVITKTITLDEIVSAHRTLDSGHSTGKTIVKI